MSVCSSALSSCRAYLSVRKSGLAGLSASQAYLFAVSAPQACLLLALICLPAHPSCLLLVHVRLSTYHSIGSSINLYVPLRQSTHTNITPRFPLPSSLPSSPRCSKYTFTAPCLPIRVVLLHVFACCGMHPCISSVLDRPE